MKSKLLFLMIGIILLIGIGSVSATIGGTITYDGDYAVHTFTSNGTFNWTGIAGNIEILIVGGGAGGGGATAGGGGGAGGIIYNSSYLISNSFNNITIGNGGASLNNGSSSKFNSLIALGGGTVADAQVGRNGGSGGGGSIPPTGELAGGIGSQGYNGGIGGRISGGGGGGAGQNGENYKAGNIGGNGGNGLQYNITNGTMMWYAGGGGGISWTASVYSLGGSGGGGNGSLVTNSFAFNGTANTGGGGGGGGNSLTAGGFGGSGIVIIRYFYPQFSISLSYPTNNSIISTSSLFNVNLSINGLATNNQWINNTYNLWFSNGTLLNQTIVTGLSTNSTNVSKLFNLNLGNYLWNSYACYGNTTFSNCSWGSFGNYSFSVNSSINSNTANALGYETGIENYILNITSPYTPYSAFLVYNGTSYQATVTSSGSNYLLSKTLQINSTMIGLNSFYYKWNLSSTFAENSSVYNQTISAIQFGLCNATLTIPYLNFTFKDEGSLTFIKASIPSSTFIYYLGDGTINKTYIFTNTTSNLNYIFCALPSNQTYYIKTNIQYKNDTSYPQRIFDEVVKAFTNATTNKTLYLLDSAQGIYVTYQVLDAIGNQLSGVQVNVNRTIEGSPYNVGNGLTDSAGSITFWLNPDFIHSLSFSKTGYETFSLAQFPTQSAYTITLGTSTGLGINDYIRGITYTFLPNSGELLNASQLYNFNLTFNSSYWTLDSFGFILYGDNVVIGGNYSTSSSGGYLENVLNVSSYTHISIKIYWIINGTTTYGINDGNYVFDYNKGTQWSIFNFFTDLKRYMIPTYHPETNSYTGIFGLNPNSLNLIIFVIIFLATGLVSYKFSLTSPAIVTGMIFGLVFLFDVGLGLISVPVGAVKHFPTIFMLLITVALAIWEMRR